MYVMCTFCSISFDQLYNHDSCKEPNLLNKYVTEILTKISTPMSQLEPATAEKQLASTSAA